MKVMLAPLVTTTGNRKNNGTVQLVMKKSYVEEKTGRIVPTDRKEVGLTPVDVTGCKDPLLDACLKSGKLVKATPEALEAAEEAAAAAAEKEEAEKAKGKGKGKGKRKGMFSVGGGTVEE